MKGSFLTPAQVAERLQVSENGVRKALREGRMPGVKLLGTWRVEPQELAEWIESHRQPPRPSRRSTRADFLAEVRSIRSEDVHSQVG